MPRDNRATGCTINGPFGTVIVQRIGSDCAALALASWLRLPACLLASLPTLLRLPLLAPFAFPASASWPWFLASPRLPFLLRQPFDWQSAVLVFKDHAGRAWLGSFARLPSPLSATISRTVVVPLSLTCYRPVVAVAPLGRLRCATLALDSLLPSSERFSRRAIPLCFDRAKLLRPETA